MSTSTALRRSVHAALKCLVDYAGLFPPAALGTTDAITEYAAAREGRHAWMLGRFIVPASRIDELGERAKDFPLSVIVNADVPPGADTSRWFSLVGELLGKIARSRENGARVEALEVLLPAPRWQRETFDAALGQLGALLERENMRDVTTYAELPRAGLPHDGLWSELMPGAMMAARRARLGVKLRCGGLDAAAFPSVEEVAAFVGAAVHEGLRFKATAGLHHPIRHYDDATGHTMHGFVNLLVAAAFAPRLGADALARVVAEEDPGAFTFDETSLGWREERVGIDDVRAMRRSSFVGYGSCSFEEPVRDLTSLGILPDLA